MHNNGKYNDFGFHDINGKDCNNDIKPHFFIDVLNLLPYKDKNSIRNQFCMNKLVFHM